MSKRDATASKAKILSTAERIFSDVGYDKARVDNIAKEAGVNKALIYYYFSSKEEILKTLFAGLVEDTKRMLVKSMEQTPEVGNDDIFKTLFDVYIGFVMKKRRILKVAIAESAKMSSNLSVVMEISNLLINAEIDSIRKAYTAKGLHFPGDTKEMLVLEFFTGLMPFLGYVLYKDEWETLYEMSEDELSDKFYHAFRKTHLAAHLPK